MRFLTYLTVIAFSFLVFSLNIKAQDDEKTAEKTTPTAEELKDRVDGIDENVTTLLNDVASLKKIKITGYTQFQFEKSEKATGLFTDPDDSKDFVQARFRMRRTRIKFAYDAGLTQAVVEGDFLNSGFTLKDAYINITDPWTKYFSLQTGVFYRPDFEVEYSSSVMEASEKTTLMNKIYPDERDLGAMLVVHPEDWFKLQLACFNNTFQGTFKQQSPLFGSEPFYMMARLTKELVFQDLGLSVDFGGHIRTGQVRAFTKYSIESDFDSKSTPDSTSLKVGDNVPRTWFGLEAQVYYDFLGGVKLMGEYITGKDVDTTAYQTSKVLRKREFSGYYLMLVKPICSDWAFSFRYDSYNPNTKIADNVIKTTSELTVNTIDIGIHNYTFSNVRLSLWYNMPMTKTNDNILKNDPKDNLLTFRIQYKF